MAKWKNLEGLLADIQNDNEFDPIARERILDQLMVLQDLLYATKRAQIQVNEPCPSSPNGKHAVGLSDRGCVCFYCDQNRPCDEWFERINNG